MTEATGDTAEWLKEIVAAEREGREAFLARDIGRLDKLWSDELLVNSPINRVHTKQQVLDLLQAGTIAHTSLDAVEIAERRQDLAFVMGSERVVDAPGTPAVRRQISLRDRHPASGSPGRHRNSAGSWAATRERP